MDEEKAEQIAAGINEHAYAWNSGGGMFVVLYSPPGTDVTMMISEETVSVYESTDAIHQCRGAELSVSIELIAS